MMKQLKALAILSLVFTLAACGSSETAQTDTPEEQPVQEAAGGEPGIPGGPVQEEAPAESLSGFEKFTAVDNEKCTVIVKDILVSDDFAIKLEVENKSADKRYSFGLADVSVNGLSLNRYDYYMNLDLPAGKKANKLLTLSKESMKDYGFDQEFTDIEVHLIAEDYGNYTGEREVDETFHIYPYGEDKAETYVREPADTDTVLVDNEDFKLVVTGISEPEGASSSSSHVNLYIENKKDFPISFYNQESYINGYQIFTYMEAAIPAGKCGFARLDIFDEDLKQNGIETIDEVEMNLSVRNYDTYDEIYSDTLKFNP